MGKDTQSKVTREFSSGGVVFKKDNSKVLWLVRLTTASKDFPKQYWMLPKGRLDDTDGDEPGPMSLGKVKANETALQSAARREVREETGVDVEIVDKIGTSIYSFTDPKVGKILKFVTFYLMKYLKDLPDGFDWETAEVKWLPFEEAYKTLSFGGEKQILKKAKGLLASLA